MTLVYRFNVHHLPLTWGTRPSSLGITPCFASNGTNGSKGRLLYPILLKTKPHGRSSISPVGMACSPCQKDNQSVKMLRMFLTISFFKCYKISLHTFLASTDKTWRKHLSSSCRYTACSSWSSNIIWSNFISWINRKQPPSSGHVWIN